MKLPTNVSTNRIFKAVRYLISMLLITNTFQVALADDNPNLFGNDLYAQYNYQRDTVFNPKAHDDDPPGCKCTCVNGKWQCTTGCGPGSGTCGADDTNASANARPVDIDRNAIQRPTTTRPQREDIKPAAERTFPGDNLFPGDNFDKKGN